MNIYWKLGLSVAVVGGAVYAVHWHAKSNYDKGFAARGAIAVKAELDATTQALKVTQGWQAALDAANKRGDERASKLETDAAIARIAADRLRGDLAGLRSRIPQLTEQAVRSYADSASIVLSECISEYRALAEYAGKIDSDRQKLEDAWPK